MLLDLNFMVLYMFVISFSLSLHSFIAINLSRILQAQIYMSIHTPDHNEHTMQGETDFHECDNPGYNYEKVTYYDIPDNDAVEVFRQSSFSCDKCEIWKSSLNE